MEICFLVLQMARGNDRLQHCVWMAIILMNKRGLFLQKQNRFGWFPIVKYVGRILAIGTRLGKEIHFQEANTLLDLLVNRKVIDKDSSPFKTTFQHSMNAFEILVAKEEGHYQHNLYITFTVLMNK